ncbi:MAG: hypothetical protein AAGH88_03240 [Planctomycetota bacterium]
MGYTHYWYRTPVLAPGRFTLWVEDVKSLHDQLPATTTSGGGYYPNHRLTAHGPDGCGDAVIRDDLVAFNGRNAGRSSLDDLSHETFFVPQALNPEPYQTLDEHGRVFSFCKTNRKPYDLLVTAALVALKHHFQGIKVLSDGQASDWEEGLALTKRVLGYGAVPFKAPRSRG